MDACKTSAIRANYLLSTLEANTLVLNDFAAGGIEH